MKKLGTVLCIALVVLVQGCTTTGDVYTGKKGQKLDAGRTIGLGIGALLLYEVTKDGGGSSPSSGRSPACTGPYCSYPQAWDYLPGSNQWRCRDTGGTDGGQFVPNAHCAGQTVVDNWP